MQCLVAKQLLPTFGSNALDFVYTLDSKSYPGETVLYVVEYLKEDKSEGMIYTVFMTDRHGEQVFNIQNNARFKWPRRAGGEIDFVDPPLGGTRTQEHLISALKQIHDQPGHAIPSEAIRSVSKGVECESYTDQLR
jgi:hypothetical protein